MNECAKCGKGSTHLVCYDCRLLELEALRAERDAWKEDASWLSECLAGVADDWDIESQKALKAHAQLIKNDKIIDK